MKGKRRYQQVFTLGAKPKRHSGRTGFTLLECIVALAILAISLTSLLSANATSVDVIGRARDMTVGTLLAQGKLIDIEEHLYDEKFKQGTESLKGDFKEEGWPEYKWAAEVREIEMDLLNFSQGLDGLIPNADEMDEDSKDMVEDSMEGIIAMAGPLLDPFLDTVANSLRLIYLTVTWPRGRYSQSISFSRLITNRDYSATLAEDGAATDSGNSSSTTNNNSATSSKSQNNNLNNFTRGKMK